MKTLVIIGVILLVAAGLGYAQSLVKPPTQGPVIEMHQWESDIGKLRVLEAAPGILVFDTYEAMTVGEGDVDARDVTVGWKERNADSVKKKLTEQAFDIHQRLLAIADVGGVFISYRMIMIQTFPLVRNNPLPLIKKVLE